MESLVKVVHVNVVQLPKNRIIFRLIFKKYNMVFAKEKKKKKKKERTFFILISCTFKIFLKIIF